MTTATSLETTRPKTTRLYISGRGVTTTEDIKNSMFGPRYLGFTIERDVDEVRLRASSVTDPHDGTITFEGVTSNGQPFTGFYNDSSFTGHIDILEN